MPILLGGVTDPSIMQTPLDDSTMHITDAATAQTLFVAFAVLIALAAGFKAIRRLLQDSDYSSENH
jgi:hypothetical protein